MTTAQVIGKLIRREVISAIKHTHLRNLHSLVLSERTNEYSGMTRIYFADDGHGMDELIRDGEFVLMPHTHRQDISLELLFGDVDNVEFNKPAGMMDAYRYEFESPILGGVGCIKMQCKDKIGYPDPNQLTVKTVMQYCDPHSMIVRTPTAAWIVRERRIAPEGYNPPCWSLQPDRVLDMTGMYESATREEIDDMCRRIIHAL